MIPATEEFKSENFYIKLLYTKCLSEACYYVESGKEAVVIDPMRDTDIYVDLAIQRGTEIKYVMLTHFHADFVSGHQDLALKTGCKILYGPTA
jgi:hydroxyacylglutathione hydrolase